MNFHYSSESTVAERNAPTDILGWGMLQAMLAPIFCLDLKSVCESVSEDSCTRRFLSWLVASEEDSALSMLAAYCGPTFGKSNSTDLAQTTAVVVGLYVGANKPHFKNDWQRRTQSMIAKVLQALGQLPNRNYPPFYPKLLPTPRLKPKSPPKSLGRLMWPELDSVGPKQRETAALDLVANAARTLFCQGEAIFQFGQSMLAADAPPIGSNPGAWRIIRSLLTSLLSELETTGKCSFYREYKTANLAEVWTNAGMPGELLSRRYMESIAVHSLALSCLGATPVTTTAVKALFCCTTGWNRAQIERLPRDPYAYRENDEAGIAETAFLGAYKARAGHFVSALLERGFRRPILSVEQRKSVWDEAVSDAPDSGAYIVSDNSMLEIMDRYVEMTRPVRQFDQDGQYSELFFISLAYAGPSSSFDAMYITDERSLLSRKGVNYQAIRRSFISITRRRLGSLELTSHLSNHSGTGIILQHYDDPELQQELDEAIAFWQNCFQTEMTRDDGELIFHLAIPEADRKWFEHMAIVAGITASIGIRSKKLELTERSFIEFIPSRSALEELYLIRRAILDARHKVSLGRWRVQAMPLLALVKALRRHAFDAGLGASYASAVRSAYRALNASTISLPKILEI